MVVFSFGIISSAHMAISLICMTVACNLFVFFDARYENRPAGPWPKHMHICLGMEPNCIHTNLTMNDRAEPKRVVPKFQPRGWSQHASKPEFHRGTFVDLLHL